MESKPFINRQTVTGNDSAELRNISRRRLKNKVMKGVFFAATMVGVIFLIVLLFRIFSEGLLRLNWNFITSFPSRIPERAGILSSLVGSLYIIGLTALVSIPLGIGTAIYLIEYARKTKLNAFIQLNISNLSGVPAIVYGILGLAIFVKAMLLGTSIVAGAFTLSLLILPVIIISTEEALKTVPNSLRENALALGVTKWQMITGVVLPFAAPGIITGCILALSRGIGEASPLIIAGAVGYAAFLPRSIFDTYTILPIQIYDWTSRAQTDFHELAASGIIVLITILLVMNGIAIFIRNRYSKRYD